MSWNRPRHMVVAVKVAAVTLVSSLLTLGMYVPLVAASAGQDTLRSGESLGRGQQLTSADGNFNLAFQTDANFVLYSQYGGNHWTWQAGTQNTGGSRLVMQTDGNLVIYNGYRAVWWSGTGGHYGARLVMQTDGNAVIYNSNGTWSGWATNTAITRARYFLGGCRNFTLQETLWSGLATEKVTGGYCWDGVTAWQWGAINHAFFGAGTSTVTDKGSWNDPTRSGDFNIYVNSTDMLPNPSAFGLNGGPMQADLFWRLWVRPDGSTYQYVGL